MPQLLLIYIVLINVLLRPGMHIKMLFTSKSLSRLITKIVNYKLKGVSIWIIRLLKILQKHMII